MSTENLLSKSKFDLYTATAEELAAHVEREERAKENNALSKLRELSDLRSRYLDDGRLMLNWIDFDRRGRTPEVIAAHRRYAKAQIDWLEKNPGDDLTPARVAFWVQCARDGLPHLQELIAAVSWVREIEENDCDDRRSESERAGGSEYKPSETLRRLLVKQEDAAKEVRDHLMYAMSWPDAQFMDDINARGWRRSARYKLNDLRDYRGRKTLLLRDITQRSRVLLNDFAKSIERAATLGEVKRLCEIFHAGAVRAERRDGATFIVGEGFEIVPL